MSGSSSIPQAALGPRAELARRVLAMESAEGIPTRTLNIMGWPDLEYFAGAAPGDYRRDPERVYLDCERAMGVCFIDQYIPRNPLTMAEHGYDGSSEATATTGAERIVCDEVVIDSPEAVVDHLERLVFPGLERETGAINERADTIVAELIAGEQSVQRAFGPDILKAPYGRFGRFPHLRYMRYGYENYLMAYALYPEVMERDFALQADVAAAYNAVAARAIVEGGLPAVVRLDHDMADSRGTLVDTRSLEQIWLPHFARAIAPLHDAGIRTLWHCDGNLMAMLPMLLEAGVGGFQGFQYEDGMDYPAICRLTDRDGGPLMIWAGVSVTTTLPHGTPTQVRDELRRLVEHGPRRGLCLGASSSITPGTPRENLIALRDGLLHYQTHGRDD